MTRAKSDCEKKERERNFAWAFARVLGCTVLGAEFETSNEDPDGFLLLEKCGQQSRVGVEVTEYHNDIKSVNAGKTKGSPGRRLEELWARVQDGIGKLLNGKKELRDIWASVKFRATEERVPDPACLAKELIDLASAINPHPPQDGTVEVWFRGNTGGGRELAVDPPHPPEVRPLSPNEYPLLHQWRSCITFHHRQESGSPQMQWVCANLTTGHVGLDVNRVVELVKKHMEGPNRKYNWQNAKEKWLLIGAPRIPVQASAGPLPPEEVWKDQKLCDACKKSGFGRIFFWQFASWYKEVWPGQPAEKYCHGTSLGNLIQELLGGVAP